LKASSSPVKVAANLTIDLTMTQGVLNESNISTSKNDPDYLQISKSKFEVNKKYMELIARFLSTKKASNHDQKSEVVIDNKKANYFVTRGSLERLKPGRWLNDEILNAYISLINQRSYENNLKHAYVMSTFFYTQLEGMRDN
jgi:Ulp1 family protease